VPQQREPALIALAEAARDLSHAATMHDAQRVVRSAARALTGCDDATLVLRDGDDDVAEPRWTERSFQIDGRSLLMIPIVGREALGAIEIYWAGGHVATESETALARALAAITAVAVENVRLAQEVERRRNTEVDLRELSERDALTGLLNRRAWDTAVSSAVCRRRDPLHVAMLDLDHFKAFNDRHGHPAGDDLLRCASIAWRGALRTADVLARYGGEEFAILLAGCDTATATEIVERVRVATTGGQSISIGLARWDGDESADDLVARADAALYEAKRAGRDRIVVAP